MQRLIPRGKNVRELSTVQRAAVAWVGGGALGESRVPLPQFTTLPLDRSPIRPHGSCGPASEIAGEVLLHKIRILIESVTLLSRTMELSDLKTIVKVKSHWKARRRQSHFQPPLGNTSQAFLERRRERVDFESHYLMISRCLSL